MSTGGTPAYMAPEQYDSSGVSDKTDTWALGCVILEMLTGQMPWTGMRQPQIMMNLLMKKETPAIPPGLPTELEAVLRECFCLDKQTRASSRNVVDKLQPLVEAQVQRIAEEEARRIAEEAAQQTGTGGGVNPAVLQHLYDRVAALERQSSPSVGAPIDPQLKRAMEQRGLTSTQQATLIREGLTHVSHLHRLKEQDFRLLGIYVPSTGAQPQGAAQPTTQQEKDELRDLLVNEGKEISATGRETVLCYVGSLTQLCQLSLQTMQAIGLNIIDRRVLSDLTLDSPATLKNILVLQKSSLTQSITLAGIRRLSSIHKCNTVTDVIDLDFAAAAQFTDHRDREVIGSLILTSGATDRHGRHRSISSPGQRVLQRAGCTTATALAALESDKLCSSSLGLPAEDASLVFTRGQTEKISLMGLQFLHAGGKKTIFDAYKLNTAEAQNLGMGLDDAYAVNKILKPNDLEAVTWQLPPTSAAEEWFPSFPLAGSYGGATSDNTGVKVWSPTLHGDPAMQAELDARGFSPRDQSRLMQEGIKTVDHLMMLSDVDYAAMQIPVTEGYNQQKHSAIAALQQARKHDECTDQIADRVRDALSAGVATASAEAQAFAHLATVIASPQEVPLPVIAAECDTVTAIRLTQLLQALPNLEKTYKASAAEKQALHDELVRWDGHVSAQCRAMLVEFVGSLKNLNRLSAPTNQHRVMLRKLGISISEQLTASQCAIAALRPRDSIERFSLDLQQKHGVSATAADVISQSGCCGLSDLLVMRSDSATMMSLGLSQEDVAKLASVQLHFTQSQARVSSNTVTGVGAGPNGQFRGAVCGNNIMYKGRHYVEFRHSGGVYNNLYYGVVDDTFNAGSGQAAFQTAAGGTWMIHHQNGQLYVGNTGTKWPGQSLVQGNSGTVLGLLLDLDAGGLSVYKAGKCLGWAVPPGSLVGPLRWNADVHCRTDQQQQQGSGVRVDAKPVPS
jgi:hypothetical protein